MWTNWFFNSLINLFPLRFVSLVLGCLFSLSIYLWQLDFLKVQSLYRKSLTLQVKWKVLRPSLDRLDLPVFDHGGKYVGFWPRRKNAGKCKKRKTFKTSSKSVTKSDYSSNFQESVGETSPSPPSSNALEVIKSIKFLSLNLQ